MNFATIAKLFLNAANASFKTNLYCSLLSLTFYLLLFSSLRLFFGRARIYTVSIENLSYVYYKFLILVVYIRIRPLSTIVYLVSFEIRQFLSRATEKAMKKQKIKR